MLFSQQGWPGDSIADTIEIMSSSSHRSSLVCPGHITLVISAGKDVDTYTTCYEQFERELPPPPPPFNNLA